MTEETLTTKDVRRVYTYNGFGYSHSINKGKAFDRWLAEHDRQVAEAERERIIALLEAGMKDNPLKGGIARAIELIKREYVGR